MKYSIELSPEEWRSIQVYLMLAKRVKTQDLSRWQQHHFDIKIDQILDNVKLAQTDIERIQGLLIALTKYKVSK